MNLARPSLEEWLHFVGDEWTDQIPSYLADLHSSISRKSSDSVEKACYNTSSEFHGVARSCRPLDMLPRFRTAAYVGSVLYDPIGRKANAWNFWGGGEFW